MADPTKQQSVQQTNTPPPFMITPLVTEHRFIKMLIYGPFGTGKTSLVASAVDISEMRDVLMVNAEAGQMSVQEAEHIKHRDMIDQVRVTDFKQVAYVQEFLLSHCTARDKGDIQRLKALQARLFGYSVDIIDESPNAVDEYEFDDNGQFVWTKARLRKYKSVIIDSLTEIDTFSMYQLLGIQTDMKLDKGMNVAQFAEFRKNNQMMNLLVRAYRDLKMNVLIVASTQYTQDEVKKFHWTPALTGKLSGQVQGFVDLVGYLQIGKPAEGSNVIPRRLAIQPIGNYDAKSRMAKFKDPFIENPTMSKIWAAFNQSK